MSKNTIIKILFYIIILILLPGTNADARRRYTVQASVSRTELKVGQALKIHCKTWNNKKDLLLL